MSARGTSNVHQTWLVAKRELRERSKSKAFRVSVLIMMISVVAIIVLPSVLTSSGRTKKVGLVGTIPSGLEQTLPTQGKALGKTIRIKKYDSRAAGETGLRDSKIDVLVVDGNVLEWRRKADEQLRGLVNNAIYTSAIGQRAAQAGISASTLSAVLAPVPTRSVVLGLTSKAGPDDETAAFVMTVLLFISISTYGSMVLSGVIEEKSSRVVEVLLARMPARNLLAGKVAGIGLLGLGQIAVTAVAALIAATAIDSVDIPAVRGSVLAWVLVWFVLGYALYATVFGAVGSLASRPEDAQAVAGPVTVVLVLAYFVSFAAIGSPDAGWARAVSLFPVTAPLAMPTRVAIGAAAWWEPFVAVALTAVTIGALVQVAGRLYSGAILHTGRTMGAREAWAVLRRSEKS